VVVVVGATEVVVGASDVVVIGALVVVVVVVLVVVGVSVVGSEVVVVGVVVVVVVVALVAEDVVVVGLGVVVGTAVGSGVVVVVFVGTTDSVGTNDAEEMTSAGTPEDDEASMRLLEIAGVGTTDREAAAEDDPFRAEDGAIAVSFSSFPAAQSGDACIIPRTRMTTKICSEAIFE